MIISLDYDKTYTLDPPLWADFIILAYELGHEVMVVTIRGPDEPVECEWLPTVCEIHYTARQAKASYMRDLGIKVDVWIDDNPITVYADHLNRLNYYNRFTSNIVCGNEGGGNHGPVLHGQWKVEDYQLQAYSTQESGRIRPSEGNE